MILDKIAQSTRARVEQRKGLVPFASLREQAMAMPRTNRFPFEQALREPGLSLICEVKKASPSKGLIAPDFPYLEIAREYERAGAAAVSVLTEPEFFLGRDEYLREIAGAIRIPALRKDFTVDAYQLYEAKLLGAQAVLLICALLDTAVIEEYLVICDQLGLSALVEAHNAQEVHSALEAGARIVGVNNRDLRTFEVDVDTSIRLRGMVPSGVLYVSESGIRTPEDTKRLRENGTDAVLIGETFMRSGDKQALFAALTGEA